MTLPPLEICDLPKCKKCKSLVRPYIVWFGENLDIDVLNKARKIRIHHAYFPSKLFYFIIGHLIENCDLCLVVGTSSVVYPAAMFAPLVAERGQPVAEFNLNEDPASDQFQ